MYYFAYGINLNKNQMSENFPKSQPKFIATLYNYRLIFTGWARQWHGGTITLKHSNGDKVLGAIYEVPDIEWGRLDKFEDCPGNYERLKVTVNDEDGDPVEAVTYIKKRQMQMDESKPSPEYLKIVQQGYKDWRLI
jgi:gamma-glutamylcyclotransferase